MHGINSRPTLLRLRAVCVATARLLFIFLPMHDIATIGLTLEWLKLLSRLITASLTRVQAIIQIWRIGGCCSRLMAISIVFT